MIKKLISIILFCLLVVSISQTVVLFSMITRYKTAAIIDQVKYIIGAVYPYMYIYGFESPIYYTGNYNKTKNIDILISNHISLIDNIVILSIYRFFDHRIFYVVMKKELSKIPYLGKIYELSHDIMLNRNFDDDIDNITEKLSNIKEGVIMILPEGTRFTESKYIESVNYSKENNLPIFKNLLFPKMKGLYTICNLLQKEKKLGNIIDLTIHIENLKSNSIMDIMKSKLGNTYCHLESYDVDINSLNNYDEFKKWFIQKWLNKDNILTNIKNFNYNKYKTNIKPHEIMVIYMVINMFLYLMKHSFGLYLGLSTALTYTIR